MYCKSGSSSSHWKSLRGSSSLNANSSNFGASKGTGSPLIWLLLSYLNSFSNLPFCSNSRLNTQLFFTGMLFLIWPDLNLVRRFSLRSSAWQIIFQSLPLVVSILRFFALKSGDSMLMNSPSSFLGDLLPDLLDSTLPSVSTIMIGMLVYLSFTSDTLYFWSPSDLVWLSTDTRLIMLLV